MFSEVVAVGREVNGTDVVEEEEETLVAEAEFDAEEETCEELFTEVEEEELREFELVEEEVEEEEDEDEPLLVVV